MPEVHGRMNLLNHMLFQFVTLAGLAAVEPTAFGLKGPSFELFATELSTPFIRAAAQPWGRRAWRAAREHSRPSAR
jgi:hypothetical protein